jgi:hypothetical protein
MAYALAGAGLLLLLLFVVSSLRAVTKVGRRVDALQAAVDELRADRGRTDGELDRVDALMERADRISARVESTSKLAYGTFATPVIKALAVGRGTSEAARRLRKRNGAS